MNKPIMRAMLFAALAAGMGAGRVWAEEDSGPVNELAAGTELPDGTVAGEVQALNYFKANDPALYKQLHDMEPGTVRRLYGKYFMWFQRVGNYRKQQKREMIRQLKNDLQIHDLYEELRKSTDSGVKAAMRVKLQKAVEDLFESDLSMLEIELRNTRGAMDELKDQVDELSKRVAERRKSKAAIIDRRMKELTGQD